MSLKNIDFRTILEQSQVVDECKIHEFKALGLQSSSDENIVRFYFALFEGEESNPSLLFQLERGVTLVALLDEERIDLGTAPEELKFEDFKAKVIEKSPEIIELIHTPPPKPFWVNIFQFFLIPMGIVILSVVIYVFFGLAVDSKKDVPQLVQELGYKKGHARWQAAYELTKKMEQQSGKFAETTTSQLIKIFESEKNQKMRTYLVRFLGYTRAPQVLPLLLSELDKSEEEAIETRIHVINVIGLLATSFKARDSKGEEVLLAPVLAAEEALKIISQEINEKEQDRDIKKIGVYTIGMLQDVRGIEILKPFLKDSSHDVRFNTAIALALLKDHSGKDILMGMLNREELKTIKGISEKQIEEIMITGLKACLGLELLTDKSFQETLIQLRDSEKNLRVKSLILKSLEELEKWKKQ